METEARQLSASSPLKPLGRALLALVVVMLGLAHALTQGSLTIGLLGLLQAIVFGWLYGRARSGLPPLLAWMAFLAL